MTVEVADALHHLDALGEPDERSTFQILPERDGCRVLPQIIHGRFADVVDLLVRRNRVGASIHVCINRTDGRGRSREHVTALRALTIDCDRPRRRPLALPQTLSVETSPARGHHYWRLVAGETLDAFDGAQRHLARYYGSDPNIHDLGRVLRLAGFVSWKRTTPFVVRVARLNVYKVYTITEIIAAHPLPRRRCAPPPPPHTRTRDDDSFMSWSRRQPDHEGQRNATAFRIAVTGFRAGLDARLVEAEVHAYCVRAGIPCEAPNVLRSARRASGR